MDYGIIYVVTNTVNGKRYIGQTTSSIKRRWWRHLRAVRNGSRCALHCAIRKYGAALFKIKQIDSAKSLDELNEKEISYVLQLTTLAPDGYNLTTGGKRGKFSKETLQKLSEMTRARCQTMTEQGRRRNSEAHKGKRKTSCPHNHPYSSVNTYVNPKTGKRRCIICYYLQSGRKLPKKLAAILSNSKKNSVVL